MNFYQFYMKFNQLYFSFDGRIPLKKFWIHHHFILNLANIFPILIYFYLKEDLTGFSNFYNIFKFYTIALSWPRIVLWIKRAHDRNKSGVFLFILFIPIFNIWPLVELNFFRGTKVGNLYSPNSYQPPLP